MHNREWFGALEYHRCWLLSTCDYNSWQQANMHLTADMCLTSIRRLINGCENREQCFRSLLPFNVSLVQHGRGSSKYIIRSYHIYKQIRRVLVRGILTLDGKEGNNHDKLPSRLVLLLTMFFESFHIFCGTLSGTEGPSLVKLPIEESVVQPFSLFFVLAQCFAQHVLA